MDQKRVVQIGLAVLLVLAATGSAAASTASILALQVERHVIAGGGGRVAQGSFALDGTIGQPLAGVVSTSSYKLCAGFWCGRPTFGPVYIPLVLRNG